MMDISLERERERQQQRNADRLRDLAVKNRGVREDVERKRALDPRERDRGMMPDRGILERERLQERPGLLERTVLGERPGILERTGLSERPGVLERTGLVERDPKGGVPGMIERERLQEIPVMMERTMVGERDPKPGLTSMSVRERLQQERTALVERSVLGERDPKPGITCMMERERLHERPGMMERGMLGERDPKPVVTGMAERERLQERPGMMERSMLGDRDPKAGIPGILERERLLDRPVMMERGILGERDSKSGVTGLLERERLQERPVMMERTMLGERESKSGVPPLLERERLQERPGMVERDILGEREPKPGVVPMDRMLERDGRAVDRDGRDAAHAGRAASLDRLRGLVSRGRDDDRAALRIREADRDGIGGERIVDRDSDREESMRELVSSYKAALAELTFNSKPIITNLTIIAGENSHAAKGISSTVFNHIMEVPKEQKLPSLYLLDSIVKNIGGEYVKYFAARLPEVFCMAYRQVDPSTNPAMQHLFRTWRGVFPAGPLRLIENELQISSSAPNGPLGSSPLARPAENSAPRAGHESSVPRTGHGIHVNPKYLEAQRQRLQQTGQGKSVPLESNGNAAIQGAGGDNLRDSSKVWSDTQLKRPPVPVRGKRDEYTESGFGREAPFDYEYDEYGSGNGPNNERKSSPPTRVGEREEGWDSGYFREGDGEGFVQEEARSSSTVYGQRNGYDWRQSPSGSTDIDGYNYNKGLGSGRGSFHGSPSTAEGKAGGGRGSDDNWLKMDEEEYVWDDMSPRLRPSVAQDDERPGGRLSKDEWYNSESDRGMLINESGRLKRTSQDAGFSDNGGWRRNGPVVPMDQARPPADRRPPKEYEELRSMQGDASRELVLNLMDQSPGVSRPAILGARPHVGWPNARNLSPTARTRTGSLQLSIPSNSISPVPRSSSNLLPRAGTPPTPSNGVGPTLNSGVFESRQAGHPGITGSFSGGSPTYNSLSSVTPSSGFQQQQQSLRLPPSPTQLSAHQSHHQQLPPPPIQQQQSRQAHHQVQHEQLSHLRLGRHPVPLSSQHQSSQALPPPPLAQSLQQVAISQMGPSLQSGQQLLQHLSSQQAPQMPAIQQQLSGLHQLQQVSVHQQQLHQPQAQQQVHQLSGPLLPLISSQLAQSLQQLAQQSQQSQQPQPVTPQQQPRASQSLGILAQALAPVANGPSTGLLQTPDTQTPNNNLLAAFLQSGLMPPPAAQILPQSPSLSSRISSTSLQPTQPHVGFQVQPPLPSGPPPSQFPYSMGTLQVGMPGQMNSAVAASLAHIPTFAVQPPRYVQPPLPPGPPPASTIVGSTVSQSASSGGALSSSISSLLSSLMAHGVIGTSAQKTPITTSSVPVVASQPNTNLGFVPMVTLPSAPARVPSATVTPAPVSTVSEAIVASPPTITPDVPPSPENPRKETISVDFKQELLREQHEYVLEALYSDFPRQCKTCGLRFKAQDEHSKHMDWHVSRNRRQKSQKKVSRKWFVSAKEWLSGTATAASESAPSFFAEDPGVKEENSELVAVPADENQSACALCGELFEDFYSDETDEWMYKGAVYLNVPQGGSAEGVDSPGPIVHLKCKTESTETAIVDSVNDDDDDDDDEVQPELQAADSVRMEADGVGEDKIMPLLTDNFELPEVKEEREDLGSRRKRTRY